MLWIRKKINELENVAISDALPLEAARTASRSRLLRLPAMMHQRTKFFSKMGQAAAELLTIWPNFSGAFFQEAIFLTPYSERWAGVFQVCFDYLYLPYNGSNRKKQLN